MSELRTLRRGRERSRVRCVQGRLSMMFGDEEEIGETEPAPVPATANVSDVGRLPVKANAPRPCFTRWPIAALSRNGPSNGENAGAAAPMRWKKVVYRGATPRRRPSSKSGTRCALIRRSSPRQSRWPRLMPSEISESAPITGILSSPHWRAAPARPRAFRTAGRNSP